MVNITEKEWNVLEILWENGGMHLNDIVSALRSETGWSTNTVHTYLKRMSDKGIVAIDKSLNPHVYSAHISREECQADERKEFLNRVYRGSAGDLIAAFLKEESITGEERDRLRKLLDEMEV